MLRELDPPLGVDERARLLGEARAGQHDVGVARRFGEEEILHGQELELLEPAFSVGDVRIGDDRVLAHDVHGPDAAFRFDDFRHHQAVLQRQ